MLDKYGDEYAYEIGANLLGQLWFERNVVVVNMGEIVRTSERIAAENQDLYDPFFSLENQVLIGFLTTAIHELRHLQLDTNIVLPEDIYPVILASEQAVEDYCRETFEDSDIDLDIIPHLFKSEKNLLDDQIQSAALRVCEVGDTTYDAMKAKAYESEL